MKPHLPVPMMLPGPTPTAGQQPAACPIKHDRCYPSILNHLCTMFPCASEHEGSRPTQTWHQRKNGELRLPVTMNIFYWLILVYSLLSSWKHDLRVLMKHERYCPVYFISNVTSLALANEQRRFSPTPSRHQRK